MQALKFFFLGALLVISTPLFSSTCGSATDMKMLSEEAISCVELFEKLDSKLNFDNGLLQLSWLRGWRMKAWRPMAPTFLVFQTGLIITFGSKSPSHRKRPVTDFGEQ